MNEVLSRLSNRFHLSISQLQRHLRHFAARLRCCPAGYGGGIYEGVPSPIRILLLHTLQNCTGMLKAYYTHSAAVWVTEACMFFFSFSKGLPAR